MSIPNESLQKVCTILYSTLSSPTNDPPQLLQEIETKSQLAQREINVVKTAVAGKQRDVRLLELTVKELSGLPDATKVYEGVGRMCVA